MFFRGFLSVVCLFLSSNDSRAECVYTSTWISALLLCLFLCPLQASCPRVGAMLIYLTLCTLPKVLHALLCFFFSLVLTRACCSVFFCQPLPMYQHPSKSLLSLSLPLLSLSLFSLPLLSLSRWQDLARMLWLKSQSAEAWLDRRTNYSQSLSVMSMAGYILGLGDRHMRYVKYKRWACMYVCMACGYVHGSSSSVRGT